MSFVTATNAELVLTTAATDTIEENSGITVVGMITISSAGSISNDITVHIMYNSLGTGKSCTQFDTH